MAPCWRWHLDRKVGIRTDKLGIGKTKNQVRPSAHPISIHHAFLDRDGGTITSFTCTTNPNPDPGTLTRICVDQKQTVVA